MNGRVLRFEGSTHHEAQRLLPWWVNGTLEADEYECVSRHLAECAQCRREAEELRGLREAYAQARPAASLQPAFSRLRRRLHARDRPASPHRQPWRNAWALMPGWLRGMVVAQGLTIVLLGSMVVGGLLREANDRDRAVVPAYHTLGATDAPVGDVGSRHLVVVFDGSARQAQVRDLLLVNHARIVDGPNDAGAYVLAVPADRVAAARAALRAAPGVVLAEPLESTTGR